MVIIIIFKIIMIMIMTIILPMPRWTRQPASVFPDVQLTVQSSPAAMPALVIPAGQVMMMIMLVMIMTMSMTIMKMIG